MGVRPGLLALAGLLLATVALAAPASAHTTLRSNSPAEGQRVATSTDRVVLEFGSPVLPSAVHVRVSDAAGAEVSTGAPRVADTVVVVPVHLSGPGRYDVAYRVMATDGHDVAGEFAFTAARDGMNVSAAAGQLDEAADVSAPAPRALGLGRVWLAIGVAGVLITLALHRAARGSRGREHR